MNKFHFFSLFCLFAGIVFFFLGFLSGDVKTGFFIIFPFLSGSGINAFLGFVLIIIAIFLFMLGFSNYNEIDEFQTDKFQDRTNKKSSLKAGGVVLIGPIPIVFASNYKIAIVLMIIAIILVVLLFLLI